MIGCSSHQYFRLGAETDKTYIILYVLKERSPVDTINIYSISLKTNIIQRRDQVVRRNIIQENDLPDNLQHLLCFLMSIGFTNKWRLASDVPHFNPGGSKQMEEDKSDQD